MFQLAFEKRSITATQVYRVGLIARKKLAAAASETEHNLRLLVGHANFLDGSTHRSSTLAELTFIRAHGDSTLPSHEQ